MTDDVADSTAEGATPEDTESQGTPAEVESTAAATSTQDTGGTGETTFFDPNEIPEELKPAYKQMQGAFTRKMQNLSKEADKAKRYDEFMRNPHEHLQSIARQLGYELQGKGQTQSEPDKPWQPQTWDDVISRAKEEAKQEVYESFGPVLKDLNEMRKSSLEQTLDESIPEWREYEDEMKQALEDHPTLANNPLGLAKLAIPDSVQESKAMQKAMKKLEAKQQGSQVSKGSTTRRKPDDAAPDKPTFQQAVEAAKRRLATEGQ